MGIKTLINSPSICTLARSYNILDYYDNLKKKVSHAYPGRNLDTFSKWDLHWLANELILEHYTGECSLKAKLVDLFIQKDVTAAFEIRVNKSRADFVTINGTSKSFEIKSGLDNLQKLSKQINDYEKVFDENYIVIDEKHYLNALKLIPDYYGVYVLHGFKLTEDRPAGKLNDKIVPDLQLKLFTKKELLQTFKISDITEEEILVNFTEEEINNRFKDMLKKRYQKRWSFLTSNKESIHSIDYQYFFQHNISPDIIYR